MYQPEDLYQLTWLEDLQQSPDGTNCAYVVRGTLLQDGRAVYTSSVWISSMRQESSVLLVQGQPQAHSPRWSPDGGTLAYVASGLEGSQLWTVAFDGAGRRQLTHLVAGVAEPAWSPDGGRLAFVSRVPALDQGDDDEPLVGPRPEARAVRRLKYKWDGKGWWDGRYGQILALDLGDPVAAQLTSGDFDHRSPTWSPDGRWIACVANRTPDPDQYNHEDLWLVPAGGGEPVRLTSSLGPTVFPVWSPDGRRIAYLGHDSRYERQTCMGLYVVDLPSPSGEGGRERNLLEGYDYPAEGKVTGGFSGQRPGSAPAFTREGDLLFISTIAGSQQVQRLPAGGGKPEALTRPGEVVYDLSYSPVTGGLCYLASDPETAGDLYYLSEPGREPARLTRVNQEFGATRRVSLPERFAFRGSGGDEVEGWLYKPPGFDPRRKYPVVLYIHGGSSPCHGYSFNLDFQVLAADGFVVFAPNERGSQGYGQERAASVKHKWCGPDYEDLMLGMDALCRLPYVDVARLGVTGTSFGGLMTNWIVTHTDRFAAAVAQASTSNRYSNWGTCDEGIHISDFIYPCDPWEDPGFYMERSPAVYVERVRTPLLLLHGDEDYRCNLEQAEQMYRALKRLGRAVEMVVFLGESHGIGRRNPANRVERMRQIRRWFRKYLKA